MTIESGRRHSCIDLHPTDISNTCSKCSFLLDVAFDTILQDLALYSRKDRIERSIYIALEMAMERSVQHGIKIGLKAQKKADAEELSRCKQQLERARSRQESSTRSQAILQETVQRQAKELEKLRARSLAVDSIFRPWQSKYSEEKKNFAFNDSQVDAELEYENDYSSNINDIPFQQLSLYGTSSYDAQQETPSRELDHTMIYSGQIKLWIHLAQYPGNERFVEAISKLCSRARTLPSSKRTKVQHYLLANWTIPSHFGPQSGLSFSDGDALDLIVDASNHGVGVVLHDVGWQGWKFKDSPKKQVGNDGKVIVSWAELIAVEVGIRMYITEGYTCTNVVLRSDNRGVLKAFNDGYWQERWGLNTILQRILGLCREYGIDITPSWIPSGENPADPISRGVYPGVDVLEPILCIPSTLPKELAKMLAPAYT